MERLRLLPGSYFCDTLTFGICLCFLKSYVIAGGCYIFRKCVKNFFNIPIKFLFCKRLGWSATERDGQTSSEKGVYVNSMASGCFRGFSVKKRLNVRGFAREYLRSSSGYGPSRSVKRRGKSSSLHSKKKFFA